MTDYGRVVSVNEHIVSTQLSTTHSAGSLTLTLESTLGLEEPLDGENIRFLLAPGTDTEELVEASSLNDELGTATLISPTGFAHDDTTKLEAYPRAISRVAWVRLDDDEEDADLIDAIVPHALYDKIPTGIREPDQEEAVALDDESDDLAVADVVSAEPEVDASFLSVDQLSALSADLGKITAGAIEGTTITGARIRTSATGARIVLNDPATPGENDRMKIYGTLSLVGTIRADSGDLYLEAPGGDRRYIRISGNKNWVRIGRIAMDASPVWDADAIVNQSPNLTAGNATALPTGTAGNVRPATYLRAARRDSAGNEVLGWIPFFT